MTSTIGTHIIILSTALIAFASCKRDIAPAVVKCAGDLVRSDLEKCQITEFACRGPRYASPTANPNNSDEFAFIENGNLVKYNISTKEKTALVSNLSAMLTPDWGKSGWIVFSAGWKIWKVHESGSGLEQITFNPRDLSPRFNLSGDKIIYPTSMEYTVDELRRNPEKVYRNKMVIIDIQGNVLDSICVDNGEQCNNWWYSGWTTQNKIYHADGKSENGNIIEYGISEYDIDSKVNSELLVSVKYERHGSIEDIEIEPSSGRVFFRDDLGLSIYDPGKDKIKKFRTSCDIEYYEDFTFTADGKYIIAVKGETIPDRKTCTFTTEYYFVRMESDGSKEEIIDMP